MSDETTELLLDVFSSEAANDFALWEELQRIAREQPERADSVHGVIAAVLERRTRQWQTGDVEELDRRLAEDKDAIEATRTPTITMQTSLAERAAWALAKFASEFDSGRSYEQAVEPLSQLSQVQDTQLRCHALPALAIIGAREPTTAAQIACDHVRHGLESDHLLERAIAAWSATELLLHVPAVDRLRGPLRTALGDRSRFVRLNAAEAVFIDGFHGHAEPRFSRADAYSLVEGASSLSVAPLRVLAEAALRVAAERATDPTYCPTLGGVSSLCSGHVIVDDILAELQPLAESSAPADRAAAAAALGFVGPGFGQSTDIRDLSVPVLHRLLDDENETVRHVVEWLFEEGPNRWHSRSIRYADGDQPEPRRLRVVDTLEDDDTRDLFGSADYLAVEGSEPTVCRSRVVAADDTMIALDDYQQANAGVATSDMVTVEPATPLDATAVTLCLPASLPNATLIEWLATHRNEISGIPVAADEVFSVEIDAEQLDVEAPDCGEDERVVYDVPFGVVETVPEGPVVIQKRTDLFVDTEQLATVDGFRVQHAEPIVKESRYSDIDDDDIDFEEFVTRL